MDLWRACCGTKGHALEERRSFSHDQLRWWDHMKNERKKEKKWKKERKRSKIKERENETQNKKEKNTGRDSGVDSTTHDLRQMTPS
jgi:hypothetical protein